MSLRKVISGGQTGADQAGLAAAMICGLRTGGWLPRGCMTSDGPRFDLLDMYRMAEHPGGYAARTAANVRDSDATVRFAINWDSPGERCTRRSLMAQGKPYYDIGVHDVLRSTHSDFAGWLMANAVGVLNVAGNSEQTAPGIGAFVLEYLTEVFGLLIRQGVSK